MRLVRYALYGVLIACVMYLAGAAYRHHTINKAVLSTVFLPIVLWGLFAGLVRERS